jgi:hypothetical protein
MSPPIGGCMVRLEEVSFAKDWIDRLRRSVPLFLALLLYFGVRMWVFGRIGGAYNGRSPGEHLADREGLLRILATAIESGLRVLMPLNDAMLFPSSSPGSTSVWGVPMMARVSHVLCFGAVVFMGAATTASRGSGRASFKARLLLFGLFAVVPTLLLTMTGNRVSMGAATTASRGSGRASFKARLLLFGLFAVVPTLLLTMTGNRVTPELTQSRFLVLPFVGFALAFGPAAATSIDTHKELSWSVFLCAVLGAGFWERNLDPYRHASARTSALAAETVRGVVPGGTVWIDGWFMEEPRGALVPRPEINLCDGAYVFGGAIGSVGRPPFVPAPGIEVRLVVPDSIRHEPGIPSELCRAATAGHAPPAFKRLKIVDGEPVLRDVIPTRGTLALEPATPAHGGSLRRDRTPTFVFGLELPPGIDAVGVRVVVPSGEAAVADIPGRTGDET